MKNGGFTLIGLLFVVIIGVLAAMVMLRLVGRSEQARVNAAKVDIDIDSVALDLYEMDNGHYPESLGDLMKKGDNGKGPYLKRLPNDPWGRAYVYERSGEEGKDYRLCSKGPDGTKAEDDICND